MCRYVPLGPFNGKNFVRFRAGSRYCRCPTGDTKLHCADGWVAVQGTVLSPWIVQHEAVEPFLCDAPEQIPAPLPYLSECDGCRRTFDLRMGVTIQPGDVPQAFSVCEASFRDLYWTFPQVYHPYAHLPQAIGCVDKHEPAKDLMHADAGPSHRGGLQHPSWRRDCLWNNQLCRAWHTGLPAGAD